MLKEKNKNNKLSKMISDIMDNLNAVIDTNSVVGKPLTTCDGSVIIPITKVTIGFISGGGEYGDVRFLKYDSEFPFAGGNGAILSMKPSGFLVDRGKGMEFIKVSDQPVDRLIDTATEFINKIGEDKSAKS